MKTLPLEQMPRSPDQRLSATVERERSRLWNFIRRRVPNQEDAEDILQDVFFELFEAYRLMKPVEQVGAWMFRVARNRIIDRFRRRKPASLAAPVNPNEDSDALTLEDLLPSPEDGPDAAYARTLLVEELVDALEELPAEQRRVFVAHEWEGRSFKELEAETGLNRNTLLARKRYAVLYLRRRLQSVYDEFRNT
jgi:RNA polymerase sigma factor (sigma-70 family)